MCYSSPNYLQFSICNFLFLKVLHLFLSYKQDFIYKKKQILREYNRHCNFLENIQVNDETVILEKYGFQFEKVIVIIRHGDRAPLRLVKKFDSLICDGRYLDSSQHDDKFYQDLVDDFIKNKSNFERLNVTSDLSNFPDNEKCLLGQLTKFGVSQHIKLGYLLSEAYSKRLSLTRTNVSNSLKITTTKFSRTFQSAFSFLFGLYSHLNASVSQSLPQFLYSYNPYFCGINESSQYCNRKCSTITKLSDKLSLSNLFEGDELTRINKTVEDLRRILAPNEKEMSKYKSIVSIFDGINAYLCHNEKLPCDPDYGCLSSNQAEAVFSYICLIGNKFQNSRAYKHSSWLKIYGLLNNLITEIYGSSKFILFSGHDISLESLKAVLEFEDCNIPPYASRVILEVYSKGSNRFIRLLYNGVDVTKYVNIENRVSLTEGVQLIEVEHFHRYVREKFQFYTHTQDYKKACGNDLETESDDKEWLEI